MVSPLFHCISAHVPLLAPLVAWAKAAGAAVRTRGCAGPDGLGYTDLAAHPDTKVATPSGTTIARIRLTRPLLAAEKPPCALTDWLQGVLEDHPAMPILQVRLHADDANDVIQACTGRANPTVNKTQRRHVGTEGTTLLFAAHKPAIDTNVPFVNRPFESEIHGTVNLTYFCCVLLVTWCHCVRFSCYLRPK